MSHSKPSWTLLVYRLPPYPTRLRIQIWRKLQALGAVYLQDGVAALPSREDLDENLTYISQTVEEMGGSATVLKAGGLRQKDNDAVRERFNKAADTRMRELVGRIEALASPEVISPTDFARTEEELTRERFAYLKARRINHFGSELESVVESALDGARRRIERYLGEQK